MNILRLIGRRDDLFGEDVAAFEGPLREMVTAGRFLVIGGAGSIGQAVTREIFSRRPQALHVVDISENNLVELVRDLRSTFGYIEGDFRTFALDCGSVEFEAMMAASSDYDYVLNLAALKHVRSEKDPFTLMRMVRVNILDALKVLGLAPGKGARKYFSVSTDKAANPVNMMGASKRIMELFLMRASDTMSVSTARFANVAFSDGSLLHGFQQRFAKRQPIAAPSDIQRYFISPPEAGELCLMSCLLGNNREIFFPKLTDELHLISFAELAGDFLAAHGFEPYECSSEDEARDRAAELISSRRWPCFFFESDTTGEKPFEEFYTEEETPDLGRFHGIGVIESRLSFDPDELEHFLQRVASLRGRGHWTKDDLVELFHRLVPEFQHMETGKYLDGRM